MGKRRYYYIRVYNDDGTSAGSTELDAKVDTINGAPVDSVERAREYMNEYLVFKGQYGIVS